MTKTPRREWDPQRNILETPLGNGWMVQEWFEVQDGRRIVAMLTICPAPPSGRVRAGRRLGERPPDAPVPAGGITARLLRLVHVGGSTAEPVIADYRRWIKQQFGADALARLDARRGRPARHRKKAVRNRRARDRFYAELARDYVALHDSGHRSPTATLAAMRDVTIEKMRSHIHLARANGLLSDTVRGKRGGTLTRKALDALAREEAPVKEAVTPTAVQHQKERKKR
jgi:hypothetical protein